MGIGFFTFTFLLAAIANTHAKTFHEIAVRHRDTATSSFADVRTHRPVGIACVQVLLNRRYPVNTIQMLRR